MSGFTRDPADHVSCNIKCEKEKGQNPLNFSHFFYGRAVGDGVVVTYPFDTKKAYRAEGYTLYLYGI